MFCVYTSSLWYTFGVIDVLQVNFMNMKIWDTKPPFFQIYYRFILYWVQNPLFSNLLSIQFILYWVLGLKISNIKGVFLLLVNRNYYYANGPLEINSLIIILHCKDMQSPSRPDRDYGCGNAKSTSLKSIPIFRSITEYT